MPGVCALPTALPTAPLRGRRVRRRIPYGAQHTSPRCPSCDEGSREEGGDAWGQSGSRRGVGAAGGRRRRAQSGSDGEQPGPRGPGGPAPVGASGGRNRDRRASRPTRLQSKLSGVYGLRTEPARKTYDTERCFRQNDFHVRFHVSFFPNVGDGSRRKTQTFSKDFVPCVDEGVSVSVPWEKG